MRIGSGEIGFIGSDATALNPLLNLDNKISGIFKKNIEDYFILRPVPCPDKTTNFDPNSVISLLNRIGKFPSGEKLLSSLEQHLSTQNAKVLFVKFNGPTEERAFNDDYSFESECTISCFNSKSNTCVVMLKTHPPKEVKITVASGDPLTLKEELLPLDSEGLNAYLAAHELSHVVSFLKPPVPEDTIAWATRKANFGSVLQELEINKSENQGYTLNENKYLETEVSASMSKLFISAEEARNLLGTIDENRVGEFHFLNDLIPYCIRIYAEQKTDLNLCDSDLLTEICAKKGIKLQKNSYCTIV